MSTRLHRPDWEIEGPDETWRRPGAYRGRENDDRDFVPRDRPVWDDEFVDRRGSSRATAHSANPNRRDEEVKLAGGRDRRSQPR